MARSNLYVVHLVVKNVDSLDGFYFFYNRMSAVAFIRKYEDECFAELGVFYPDFSGMYHFKPFKLCPPNL